MRYRVKPDQAERNAELIRAVYEELRSVDPTGMRYATFRLDDGVSFVHIAEFDGQENPLSNLGAFKEFQRDIEARCDEPPVAMQADEVGSFRFRPDA
ncbi:MAG: hypothetical protein ACJ786_05395 [Catenulispora sp.]